ncbi:glutamate receptor ionotropic, delta-1-like, partial [Penaeus japonicus]|uniref:glutamate receptor ionotropic, delta-1-like n=1 Tax=Penaeus japonicus TaxID=27405 RepID=UPI001C716E61
YRGFEITLLDELATAINFTYHYVRPEDGQWGRLTSNGTWTGMIGMVATEKADFAVSDIGISTPREEAVDFTEPFIYDASELFTPLAKPLPQWLGPVRPFTAGVWLAVAAAVVTAGPFLTLVVKFCAGSSNARVKWFQNIANAVMFTTQPVFQRGNHRDIVEAPGRVFVGFWLLFSMILGITYSSSLISFLVSPGLQEPIKNLEELVTSDIDWARVYYGGIQSTILEQATDPVMVALREGVNWRKSLENILKDVAKGTTATWDNSITTRLLIAVKFTDRRGRPKVHMPGFNVHVDRIAWPLLEHAPFKRRFDQLIDRVVQAGLVEKWLQSLLFEEQRLVRQRGGGDVSQELSDGGDGGAEGGPVILSLEHFQGPFFVYVLGNLAGGLVLLFEMFVRRLFMREK